jgi:tyrosine-protein kinase Etk/Wzc
MASKKKTSAVLFQNTSIRDEIGKYLRYWPWFLFWLILAGFGAYFYLKYATPVYNASASIIINEDNGNNKGSEMAAYGELGFLSGLNSNNINKDITILKSRRLMMDVVNILRLNIQYFEEDRFGEVELYDTQPFQMNILKIDENRLKQLGGGKFAISSAGENSIRIEDLNTGKVFRVKAGTPFNFDFANVVIKPKPGIDRFSEIIVKFSDPEKTASKYRGKIIITQTDKSSNVIEISLNDPLREKAKDIIDQLILEFNRDAIEDKNLIAGNTANFINDRLEIINSELETVETGKEEFKETNRLTDIQTESRMYMESAREYNSRRQEVGTQMELGQAMLQYLSTLSNNDLLPANLGIQEAGVNQQIGEYNNLVLERNRILGSSTDKNPVVVRLNNRLEQIKNNISQSLQGMLNNLRISQEDLNRQSSSIGSRILAVPSQEREYRGIERQQNIKEALYLFLLQKREENSLALAITAPKAKIVDRAFSSGGIVSPNSRSIYLGSIFLGLFIPFSLAYLKEVMDNKIRNRNDIKKLSPEITLLGELPKIKKKKDLLIGRNDRSVVAEAFRILLTNLRYLQVNLGADKTGIILFVTSTVKGEGKTFTSVNLAATLANNGKKVLMIGADLRNPKLEGYKTEHKQNLGVSDYLVNNELDLKSLIDKSRIHENLEILGSGSIPPNPTELLNLPKVGEIFESLKHEYDYIIVDTAPAMMVADTFILSHYADLTLYIIRAGYTEKELLEFAVNAKNAGSIKNVGFVLNNVDLGNLGYGSSYGYGYSQEKPGLLKRSFGLNTG